jgi:hypothetical protein
VSIWNSRAARKARPSFYPTIETALLAGTPWLYYQCPACQLIGDVDLRTLDRHPMLPISGLIPSPIGAYHTGERNSEITDLPGARSAPDLPRHGARHHRAFVEHW